MMRQDDDDSDRRDDDDSDRRDDDDSDRKDEGGSDGYTHQHSQSFWEVLDVVGFVSVLFFLSHALAVHPQTSSTFEAS